MKGLRRALTISAAAGVLVAGCTAAAHLPALQPPPIPTGRPLAIPSAATSSAVGQVGFQRGIDIDFYTRSGEDVAGDALATIRYVQSLHANAVSISFPFFMASRSAAAVHGGNATPTPAQIAVVAADAERAGITVSLRPLLDEQALHGSRTNLVPANPAAWFASYWRFLRPYAEMAQHQHIAMLITGAEFTQFTTSPRWTTLANQVRTVYHGDLGCADNLDYRRHGCGGSVQQLVDAYHPLLPPLAAAWRRYDRKFPRGTVLSEVGIAAVPGAYIEPWRIHWPGVTSLDPSMQAQWFTDACNAAITEHLGGIYFWSLSLSTHSAGPTLNHEGNWAHSSGAQAISSCFAKIEGRGK